MENLTSIDKVVHTTTLPSPQAQIAVDMIASAAKIQKWFQQKVVCQSTDLMCKKGTMNVQFKVLPQLQFLKQILFKKLMRMGLRQGLSLVPFISMVCSLIHKEKCVRSPLILLLTVRITQNMIWVDNLFRLIRNSKLIELPSMAMKR